MPHWVLRCKRLEESILSGLRMSFAIGETIAGHSGKIQTAGKLLEEAADIFSKSGSKGNADTVALLRTGPTSVEAKQFRFLSSDTTAQAAHNPPFVEIKNGLVPVWKRPLTGCVDDFETAMEKFAPNHPISELVNAGHHRYIVQLHNAQAGMQGTGFLLTGNNKLIATANHVVKDTGKDQLIAVKNLGESKGWDYGAQIIAKDPDRDIALLQITRKRTELTPNPKLFEGIPTRNLPEPNVSDASYAWGYPTEALHVAPGKVKGIVPAKELKNLPVISSNSLTTPGFSGGPAFNSKGEVMGLTSFGYSNWGDLTAHFVPVKHFLDIARKAGV